MELNDFTPHPVIEIGNNTQNSVSMYTAGTEMLRVSADGFYVRGKKLEVDNNEALAVYKAFKSFLTYYGLSRE